MSKILWAQYFEAMRAGDVARMAALFDQIQAAERVERARRSTRRSVAKALESLS